MIGETIYFEKPWCKDADLAFPEKKVLARTKEKNSAVFVADNLIDFYQSHLSPTTCKRSHFRPTSSHYMRKAINRYGFLQGFIMGCDRLLRENDEKWVYKIVIMEEGTFKYDPAFKSKYQPFLEY